MPTNTPLPTVSTGGVIAAGTTNDTAVLNTCIGILGYSSSLNGALPSPNAPNFQIQAGLQSVTFTSGVGTLFFPTPFTTGLLAITVNILDAGGATNQDSLTLWNPGTSSDISLALGFNGVAQTGAFDICYIAIGF